MHLRAFDGAPKALSGRLLGIHCDKESISGKAFKFVVVRSHPSKVEIQLEFVSK